MRYAIFVLLAAACASTGMNPSKLSQAQLNAIETRIVEADMNATFKAASNALLDAGYTISMSDREGGLLSATREVDRTAQRIFISGWIKDTKYVISVHMDPNGAKQTAVRIKMSVNGQARVKKEVVDELWVLMQRQVLMKEPPDIDLKPGQSK